MKTMRFTTGNTEAMDDLLDTIVRERELVPGSDLNRPLLDYDVSDEAVEEWERRGWIEDRGHWILTRAGYQH